MDITPYVEGATRIFSLVGSSSAATLISIVGLALLLLTGAFAYTAIKSKPDELAQWVKVSLFICLIGGVLFSAVGPGIALLSVTEKSITKMTSEQALKNLEDNAQVNYLIRLISYDPSEEPALAIDRLTNLGPPDQLYSF